MNIIDEKVVCVVLPTILTFLITLPSIAMFYGGLAELEESI
ncbi:ammonium transporter precursor [Methanothermus fervidus DSM 2088]|uniref:Ammonium transporter n=1 Tax=Methanothermus fervidus (strain ATCC 43054 / DSM 2088 / JCM 10308 / V24 S) TaxID=523846 RepID=E3GXW9_METFV|nr:hypothetical protein [Methanothermus fervidus]ADP77151.1 ammonium transporter precursor [Methanothermus fervidus DSM 2088]